MRDVGLIGNLSEWAVDELRVAQEREEHFQAGGLDSTRTVLFPELCCNVRNSPPIALDPYEQISLFDVGVACGVNKGEVVLLEFVRDGGWDIVGNEQRRFCAIALEKYGPDSGVLDVPLYVDLVVREDQVPDPNGLCFSPDYKKLYVISTGQGPGDTIAGGKGDMYVFDVGSDNRLSNGKVFSDFMVDNVKCGPDGVRADVDGNLWCSSNAGRNVGYSGVTVWTPQGQLIGRIRLPEICGNVCFGGGKRNRLFMAASQSLYSVYTGTQGAVPG